MSDQTPGISLEAYAAERETGVTIDARGTRGWTESGRAVAVGP
jgi:hypothetical protein